MKQCTKCKQSMPPTPEYYYRDKSKSDGLSSRCKECAFYSVREQKLAANRAYSRTEKGRQVSRESARRHRASGKYKDNVLRREYGITLDDYNERVEEQRGLCLLCGKPETLVDKPTGKIKSLHVDHDHETGKVRGLLCGRCNRVLGIYEKFERDIGRYSIDMYLERGRQE